MVTKRKVSSNSLEIIAVIQGPVISIGRTFETTEIGKTERDESKLLVRFDSRATILDSTSRFAKQGVRVVYSGWSDDCPADFQAVLKNNGACVVLSDPKDARSTAFENAVSRGPLGIDNRSKQFYSLSRALESVDCLSGRVVIKLRSDISLDVERLLHAIRQRQGLILASGILVQHLRAGSRSQPSLWIPDFWFAGRGDVLFAISRDLWQRSMSGRSYSDSPHLDLGNAILRYHWPLIPALRRKSVSLRSLARRGRAAAVIAELGRRFGDRLVQTKTVSLYRSERLMPASRAIAHSVRWRGDSYGQFVSRHPEADKSAMYAVDEVP